MLSSFEKGDIVTVRKPETMLDGEGLTIFDSNAIASLPDHPAIIIDGARDEICVVVMVCFPH